MSRGFGPCVHRCLLSVLVLLALQVVQALETGAADDWNTRRLHRRPARAAGSATLTTTTTSSSSTSRVSHAFSWHAPSRHHRRQQQQQQQQQATVQRSAVSADVLSRQSSSVSCSADAMSKQTCLFHNVCLLPTSNSNSSLPPSLTVVLPSLSDSSSNSTSVAIAYAVALLKKHLVRIFAGQKQYQSTHFLTSQPAENNPANAANLSRNSSNSRSALQSAIQAIFQDGIITTSSTIPVDHGVTVLWRAIPHNQQSFGHALLNEAFPLFLVMSNHFGVGPSDMPRQLQLLVSADGWQGPVLPHVLADTITANMHLLSEKLELLQQQAKLGVCFRHLLVGDGGYISASRASLANSGKPEAATYAAGPSFFSSRNWLAFRTYTMQVAGVVESSQSSRPLILLNDKRYHDHGSSGGGSAVALKSDRRMIVGIEHLAAELRAAYPSADIVAVRFRDLSWPDQLQMLSQAKVFISTQGSSAFRWVWLPPGSTCVVIGAPEVPAGHTEWKSFHELDRWFPLSYVTFQRYIVDANNTNDYVVSVKPGQWQPKDPAAAKRWRLYNADVRVDIERLKPMIDQALGL